jgi:hypothetical protein
MGQGFQVVTLEELSSFQPDLVLIDHVECPQVHLVKAMYPHVPVIVYRFKEDNAAVVASTVPLTGELNEEKSLVEIIRVALHLYRPTVNDNLT